MVAITAQQMLDENNYTDSNISLINLEYLIDNAIHGVNLLAGTSMTVMTGVAASKTVTVTADQSAVLKPLIVLFMRSYLDRGPNTNVSSISVVSLTSDPQYRTFMQLWKMGLTYLRGRSFTRT